MAELCERLVEQGIVIKIGALWHQLNKWNLTFKKTLYASEQEREDVQRVRKAWQQALPTMEVEKLVFIDVTWISTSMTRRYGRAFRGQCCLDSAPHGHWETTATVPAPGTLEGMVYLRPFITPEVHLRVQPEIILQGLALALFIVGAMMERPHERALP